MLRLVHKILDKYGSALTNKEKKIIIKAMQKINFHKTAILLANEFKIEARSLSSKAKFIESSIEFQLLHMGDLLKRKDKAEYDERVQFKPDSWQRDLINIVDKGGSALIVAPTSAGKTFISYYCMKKILESSNGVVVYVAPTKALVTQVTAEIYLRFKDSTKLEQGVSLIGVFTRDIRFNPVSCRVLVTVPHFVLAVSKEIMIDLGMLPFFKYSKTAHLNRYIVDFFEHGDMKALVTTNGLRPGDDYKLTKTFSLLLKSIYYAMKSTTPTNDSFKRHIPRLMNDYDKLFKPQAEEREL